MSPKPTSATKLLPQPRANPSYGDRPDRKDRSTDNFAWTTLFVEETGWHRYLLSDGSILSLTRCSDRPFIRIEISGDLSLPEELNCDWTDCETSLVAVTQWLAKQNITVEPIQRSEKEKTEITKWFSSVPLGDLKIYRAD